MVSPTRTADGLSRIRALNRPQPVQVRTTSAQIPTALRLGAGSWQGVEQVLEMWRIDEEWWRPRPVHRLYYRVALSNGAVVDVYYDLLERRWYRQRYHSDSLGHSGPADE